MANESSRGRGVIFAWLSICALLLGFAVALLSFGDRFAWELELAKVPALGLTAGLMAAGLVWATLMPLVGATEQRLSASGSSGVLALIIVTGFAMRFVMLPSMPALEDDFYRYLWDGGVTASGYNPYALSPDSVRDDAVPPAIQKLAEDGALILERVNHSHLKTIYPPVAEAAFALAHWLEPWSLRAWRIVCLAGDYATLVLLLVLLALTGRSALWVALYWLNPLVVKELLNSAHMEAIVLPFVLGALVLLAVRRPLAASVALGLAIGAKLWPVMLLPLVLRPLIETPWRLLLAVVILAVMALAWVAPPVLGGLDSDSGFVAYAQRWQTNSALFPAWQEGLRLALAALGIGVAPVVPGLVVRFVSAAVVFGVALSLARTPADGPDDIIRRAAIIVGVLFLLSPAQFPWYGSWVLIFAPFFPLAGFAGLTVLLPIYYVSFYLFANPDAEPWEPWLLAGEWLAIGALFAFDGWRRQWSLAARCGTEVECGTVRRSR